jgi:hypothetical protein
MEMASVAITSFLLFGVGTWIAATKHWLWAVPVCFLPVLVFKLFFMADVLERIAVNEPAPVADIAWFLAASPIGVVVGTGIKALIK